MNFFREISIPRGFAAYFFAVLMIVSGAVGSIYALDPNRAISQFKREKWGIEQGFSGGTIYSFAQTAEGFLWIGCDKGLVRFDGINFQAIPLKVSTQLLNEPVIGLLTDGDGNLWVRLGRSALLRYRDGKFITAMKEQQQPVANVTAMSRTSDGKILVSTLHNELLENGEDNIFKPFSQAAIPQPIVNSVVNSIAKTPRGEIWLGTRDSGLLRVRGNDVAAFTEHLPDLKINCLLPDGERGLWIGTDKGLVRWDGEQISVAGVPQILENIQILTIQTDGDQNIWLGTDKLGLARMNVNGAVATEFPENNSAQETAIVTTLFQDREGNLWTGGAEGIERFRDSAFATYSTAEGLPNDKNGAIFVDGENRIWFAPLAGGLYWFKGNKIEKITADGLADDIVYSITGEKNDLWIGRQRGGLTNLHFNGAAFTAKTYTTKDGLAQMNIYAVHQDRDGGVWAGTLSGGASLFKNGLFTNYTNANGLAANTVTAIAVTADGTIWIATPTGLSAFKNGNWRTIRARDGLPSENIISLLTDTNGGLWIGTAKGLAFVDVSGRLRSLSESPAVLSESILGIAEDKNGGLWISTPNHVLRAERSKLLAGKISESDVREYDLSDGLKSSEGIKRSQTVVADSAGRVWFSLARGISMVDTERLKNVPVPAIVQIQSIAADGGEVDLIDDVRLRALRQRLTFGYSGLSLTMPERLKFRYFLENFDKDWSEPTAAREAVYTNLSPGEYIFHVVASNSDGVWNSNEATIFLTIEPAYWQTWWFRLMCAIAVAFTLLGLYRLRLRGITGALNRRFEERLAERTLIAQELHDSLLQGVVSASMQLNVAVDNLPEASVAKPQFNRVVQLMEQVTTEGRNTLRGLRSPAGDLDNVEKSFADLEKDFARLGHFRFRVIVEGESRTLSSIVRDEVFSIGREALLNACRHSNADNIDIIVEYAAKHLRVVIRDDGRGINQEVLQNGREGHWGLIGMRERAEKIGARLKVWSRANAGTEIELLVPQRVAYQKSTAAQPFKWLSKSPLRQPKTTPREQEQ